VGVLPKLYKAGLIYVIGGICDFTPLEIMPRCSAVPPLAGLDFRIIPAGFIPFRDKSLTGFNAPLEFLTGFT
jgi:hypothetical protein